MEQSASIDQNALQSQSQVGFWKDATLFYICQDNVRSPLCCVAQMCSEDYYIHGGLKVSHNAL